VSVETSGSTEVVVRKFVEKIPDPLPSIVAGRREQTAQGGYREKALVKLNNTIYSDRYSRPGVECAAQL
jgi:hypothetical protein